ncbi:hypothetical protein BJY01DRAFT_260516 [Aspergillus pseudoustus]|uniref:Zn(2)-C6 fungal-type domain-containing protein n=1 Tax=Aspergillus pseudoustus TaxID=1810923 RepID=A0ABR4IV30_9EURO
MENYAHQACTRCRNQKRKCNRLLPICTRCKRLKLQCRYQGIEVGHKSPDRSDITQLTLGTLGQNVQSHVFAIIGNEEAIALSATIFFSTIHPWFPIVNRDSYYRGLSRFRSEASPEFSLLTLCMYLLGLYPTDGDMSGQMHGQYILASALVASLTAAGVGSVNVLQARILLSLFEVGHGKYSAAYASMGGNVRAAADMGIGLPQRGRLDRLGPPDAAEDAHHVWGCLVVLDRAFMIIMENGYRMDHPPGKDCSPLSIALLQADVEQFVNMCEDSMQSILDDGGRNIPVFFVHTIGTSALMILRYFRDSPTTNATPSIHCLQRLLTAVSNRWLVAGYYLEKIRQEQEAV